MNRQDYIGWDVGGAHLKVAHVDGEGRVVSALQLPTPLWEGLHVLPDALSGARRLLPKTGLRHSFTTTAELADIFIDRRAGINELARQLHHVLKDQCTHFYAGEGGWIEPSRAIEFVDEIASANWHATARFVASRVSNGVLVDIGSTTTDIVPFVNHELRYSACGDFLRLQKGELVYTGIVRTPVMAITDSVYINGERHPLVAEHFASMADVYRLTGELQEEDDMMAAADGAGKTKEDSARRLARMLGTDMGDPRDMEPWYTLAGILAAEQLQRINRPLNRVIAACGPEAIRILVGAGAGRFLARKLAEHNGLQYLDFADIIDTSEHTRRGASRSAAAVSVAQLSRADSHTGAA